jgi:hypothetical protein
MKRSSRALGWCPPCGKLLYATRKQAKKVSREHNSHMNEYRCPVNPAMFHVGGLPEAVIKGKLTRNEYYGDAS